MSAIATNGGTAMHSVETRLAAVERQLRFQRAVIAGLLVALVALVGYGATEGVPDVIRAREFEVVNEKGQVVVQAVADSNHSGIGRLRLFNAAGGVGTDLDMYGLTVTDVFTKEKRIILDGSPGGARLVLGPDGKTKGRTIGLFAGGRDSAGGYLGLYSRTGELVVRAMAQENGGSLSVYNKTGERVVEAGADEYGLGRIGVFDREGKGRTLTPR